MSGKNESNDTLIRQWEMLRLIPTNNQRITTSELATRLEQLHYPVTLRTIQRDLQKLSTHFPITCDEDSGPGEQTPFHSQCEKWPAAHRTRCAG